MIKDVCKFANSYHGGVYTNKASLSGFKKYNYYQLEPF